MFVYFNITALISYYHSSTCIRFPWILTGSSCILEVLGAGNSMQLFLGIRKVKKTPFPFCNWEKVWGISWNQIQTKNRHQELFKQNQEQLSLLQKQNKKTYTPRFPAGILSRDQHRAEEKEVSYKPHFTASLNCTETTGLLC